MPGTVGGDGRTDGTTVVTPRRKPLARGELEAMVLDALWDADEWMIPSEVHEVVGRRRRLAYTTIMTTMVRLFEKDRLDRRPRGRAFEYRPTMDRTEYAATKMHEFLAAAGDPKAALTHFVATMPATDVAELRKALRGRSR